jgi:hypothetical protein
MFFLSAVQVGFPIGRGVGGRFRLSEACCPHPQPLSHAVGEGRYAPTPLECCSAASASGGSSASALHNKCLCVCFSTCPPPNPDKGTSVRHRIAAARAIFPSASVNWQVRCIALTPFVPLSRLRERGNALQGAPPCAPTPLSHSVGEGLGVRAKKRALPANSEPKRCALTPFVPLSRLRERGNALQGAPPCAPTPLSHSVGEGLGVRAKKRARLAHSELKRCALTPFVPLSRLRERGNALQGAPPCAPTPLSHAVGEGLGVRAKKRARLAHSELKRCTLISRVRGGLGWGRCLNLTAKTLITRTPVSSARLRLCVRAGGRYALGSRLRSAAG